MRRTMSLAATAMAVVLASLVLAASTLAGNGVTVSAETPWVFGGIEVEEGATYDVTARGYVLTAKIPYYHVPGEFKGASGPAGQPDQPCLEAYENTINGDCTVLEANFGALVGVVIDGQTGWATADPFVIGADPSFVAPADGVLFLAVNDLNLTYYDNNGQFGVVITSR
jgi:hypothetical protein